MVYPELRHILSPELEPPALPPDPVECAVPFRALIGPRGGEAAEAFTFTVVTPAYVSRNFPVLWGRGYLVVRVFEWAVVVRAIAELLAQCARPTWQEVADALNRELHWEYDSYRAAEG